jgi:hypothetical protein
LTFEAASDIPSEPALVTLDGDLHRMMHFHTFAFPAQISGCSCLKRSSMAHDPSFHSDKHEGSSRGSRGFTAQTIVLLHRLPKLFGNASFEGVVYEGQEDFDLHFTRPEGKRLRVVQCRSMSLTNPEVREVLDGMYERYMTDPDLYEGFELVAQAFRPKVDAVRQGAHVAAQVKKGYAGTATERSTSPDFAAKVDAMLAELKCTSGITAEWPQSTGASARRFRVTPSKRIR